MNYLLVMLFVVSCAYLKRDNREQENSPAIDFSSLVTIGDSYCVWTRPKYKESGFVHSKCDGFGFTSLFAVRCPNVDLTPFCEESGKCYRSPTKDCLLREESASEFSRDMALMRAVSAWIHKDTAWLSSFLDYVRSNNFIFCKHNGSIDGRSRCIMSPTLFKLLSDQLSAMNNFRLEEDPQSADLEKVGFTAHLEVLFIWLSGKVYGAITDSHLAKLRVHAAREPKNALFQAVYHRFTDGDMSQVFHLLDSWPKDRLPNNSDWCEEYLWQRDSKGQDWEPCASVPPISHSGTDFNLALYVAMDG